MRHKWADIIHAYAEGAEIECDVLNGTGWRDCKNPAFHIEAEYRIKPKLIKKWQWAYKAYSNCDGWNITHNHHTEANFNKCIDYVDAHKLEFTEIEVEE